MPVPPPELLRSFTRPVKATSAPLRSHQAVPAPDGYRWHLDTFSWRRGDDLGDLELIRDDVEVDDHGMLWSREPIPGKKRKTRIRPAQPRARRTVYRLRSIRRLSRAIVREHHRLLAKEQRIASGQAAVRATLPPTGPTPAGGAR